MLFRELLLITSSGFRFYLYEALKTLLLFK